MALIPTVNVTATIHNQDGSAAAGAIVTASLNMPDTYNGYVAPKSQMFTADINGQVVMPLWSNALGVSGSQYRFKIVSAQTGKTILNTLGTVPNSNTSLNTIAGTAPPPALDQAAITMNAAIASAAAANTDATSAATSAATAASAATNASTSASEALNRFSWKGSYIGATAYAVNDCVSYLGASYVCISVSTGNSPVVSGNAWWQELAIKGATGSTGSTGSTGQGVDHTTRTAGTGAAGTTDTYTVWGDAGETVNLGTYQVTNGADSVGALQATNNLSDVQSAQTSLMNIGGLGNTSLINGGGF